MSKNPSVNIYEALLGSIEDLSRVEDDFCCGRDALTSLTKVVLEKEQEITKFTKISAELRGYFENYDFQSGFQFDRIHGELEALSELWGKLVTMGEVAKALSSYPDCYGSAKAIETCKGLVFACRDKLGFKDLDSVSKVVDSNIEKLLSIQKQFASDDYILGKIKEAIDKETKILSKYKAASAELQLYVKGFPHQGQDNLAEVEKYINTVIQIDAIISETGKQISLIEPFYDRHQKSSVVSAFARAQKEAHEHFICQDFEQCKHTFEGIIKQAQGVLTAFEKEKNELMQLQSSLEKQSPDIWKEDNARLMSKTNKFLADNLTQVPFNIEEVKKDIKKAKDKRKRDIHAMTTEYPWLTNEKYKGYHNNLISRYISYSEYKSAIESVRGERNKKILKGLGIGIAIVAGIGLICAYWQVILGIIVVILIGGVLTLFSKSSDD